MSIMTNLSPVTPGYQILPFQAGTPMVPQAIGGSVLGSMVSGIAGSFLPIQTVPQVPLATTPWVGSPIGLTNVAPPVAQMLPQGAIGSVFGQAELSGSLGRISGNFLPFQQIPQMAPQCLMSEWLGANHFLPVATPTACMSF